MESCTVFFDFLISIFVLLSTWRQAWFLMELRRRVVGDGQYLMKIKQVLALLMTQDRRNVMRLRYTILCRTEKFIKMLTALCPVWSVLIHSLCTIQSQICAYLMGMFSEFDSIEQEVSEKKRSWNNVLFIKGRECFDDFRKKLSLRIERCGLSFTLFEAPGVWCESVTQNVDAPTEWIYVIISAQI